MRLFFEIGVKLAHVLWRKVDPAQRRDADEHLAMVTYNLIAERRHELAKTLLDFATEVLKYRHSTDVRLRFVINRAQAYRWSGNALPRRPFRRVKPQTPTRLSRVPDVIADRTDR